VDLTLPDGDAIPIEERPEHEVTGFTVCGTFEADSPAAARAFDVLTENGSYPVRIAKGHRMEFSRKGAAYQLDAWFRVAPLGIEVYNPAFDVTPARLVTGIITERGVARPDYAESLAGLCVGSGAIHEI
jgi:methylthioribose-1-phosphate isomerase